MNEAKLEKAKALIRKQKEIIEAQREFVTMKWDYAKELCPIQINDVVTADNVNKSEIKVLSIVIDYIAENEIVFSCSGRMRKKNGEFGNRILSKRVVLEV
ncbi:hypothetical protein ACFGXH_04615 [Pasteurella multocida]|nr:hypothetical protein [Pasteurella multocida]MDY0692580.1 hypothetical protein [Pasteurella multocida]HDR1267275.1 hypothetical protein [Pasteurella multocida]